MKTVYLASIQSEEHPRIIGCQKRTVVEEVSTDDPLVGKVAAAIGVEWQKKGGNPNRYKHTYQCSGDAWTLEDEGAEVARDLGKPGSRKKLRADQYQKIFVARYADEDEAIAIMVIEMRREDDNYKDDRPPGREYLYIRWLLASPIKRGGGSALVAQAKVASAIHSGGDLRVDSAGAAAGWYEKQAFKVLYAAAHHFNGDCGCKCMAWGR
ncbi:hypothetical protein EO087_02610 [Dyella sp. M7H15-1]|uniref:hypothetical protein n=1 Tax=Dyella sp. M7H15-1 TaxID=2501295 RepID=UPI00100514CE|nr:hypothetical protein [Dyella sp. M7H15-1]QAU23018.1 hypothetical protein EO087_02610 [Dyella sp. M7H15-1]